MRNVMILLVCLVGLGCGAPRKQNRPADDLTKALASIADNIPKPKTENSVLEIFPSVVMPGRGESVKTLRAQAFFPAGAESTGKPTQFRIGKAVLFAWLAVGLAKPLDIVHLIDQARKNNQFSSFRKANGWVGYFESSDSGKFSSWRYQLIKPGMSLAISVSWPDGDEAAQKQGIEAADMVAWTIKPL